MSLGGSEVRNPPVMQGNAGDVGSVPESGRSPGEGSGYPLQYSSLENPLDRGVLQVQRVSLQQVRHD